MLMEENDTRLYSSVIVIEQHVQNSYNTTEWKRIPLSKIRYGNRLNIEGRFRIIVDDLQVYERG